MKKNLLKISFLSVFYFTLILLPACSKLNPHLTESNAEIGRFATMQGNGKVDPTFPIIVEGKGVEPNNGSPQQKQLMANRAAIVDAYRNLSERIAGLVVDSHTRQGEFQVSEDYIMSETNSYLRGAKVVTIVNQDGVTTATVKILLPKERFLWYEANLRESGEILVNKKIVVSDGENLVARPYMK
jgi:hypothetical protein